MFIQIESMVRKLAVWSHRFSMFVVLPCMALVVTVDVILRYVFNAPLIGSVDANGLFLLLGFSASLTYSWNEGKQLRVEIIYSHLKGPFLAAVHVMTLILGMCIFGLLGYTCIKEIPEMIRIGEAGLTLAVPLWPFKGFLGLFCLLLSIQLLMSLLLLAFSEPKGGKVI
jgi:TRAP-type mannitol/chloroaromatic compound transport system permease small subunit